MIHSFLNYLITDLREHELVKKHRSLRNDIWIKSNYEHLSEIISDFLDKHLDKEQKSKLSYTISSKTLINIFKKEYDISYPLDKRSRITLDKLAIFLGHISWDVYADYTEQRIEQAAEAEGDLGMLKRLIEKCINAEYLCYNSLPQIDMNPLQDIIVQGKSAHLQIQEILIERAACCWSINNPFNPSSVELLDFEVLQIDDNKAKVRTEEYWLLCWYDQQMSKYAKRYKDINEHIYILEKINGKWLIKTKASNTDILALDNESN